MPHSSVRDVRSNGVSNYASPLVVDDGESETVFERRNDGDDGDRIELRQRAHERRVTAQERPLFLQMEHIRQNTRHNMLHVQIVCP
jgi:hypothetical protein